MATLTYDGVTREISDVVANDDKLLKKIIKQHFGIETYDTVRGKVDGKTDVTIVKKAQSKGNVQERILQELLNAPEYLNPAVAFAIRKLEAEHEGDNRFMFIAIQSGEAQRAESEGTKDAREVEDSIFRIVNTAPIASADVPVGF